MKKRHITAEPFLSNSYSLHEIAETMGLLKGLSEVSLYDHVVCQDDGL